LSRNASIAFLQRASLASRAASVSSLPMSGLGLNGPLVQVRPFQRRHDELRRMAGGDRAYDFRHR
jgi:hypothetical protein